MTFRRDACRCSMLVAFLGLGWIAQGAESRWVGTGVTGRLIYTPDAQGDRILDFSNVGYRGQGAALIPASVETMAVVSPVAGDDTASIQAAIDQVSALPLGPDGYRGAVLLQAGTYDINSHLEIRASGVVLRGAGQGSGGSVLQGRNPLAGGSNPNQRPLIQIFGNGSRSLIGPTFNMVDKVVPAGSRSFRLDSTAGLSVGDTVRIERPSTQEWIEAVGMDNPPDGDPPWEPGTMNVRYDRVVTRIEGDRVFVDAPLANSFDVQFGGGSLREYTWAGAIENIGIENLRGDSDFTSPTDENHAWEFISIGDSQNTGRAQNVWVRDVTSVHFGDSSVVANPGSKWVTVERVTNLDPVSLITGSRRYTFDLSGELGFVTGSSADSGRHDFVNNSTRPAGPNVFHNSMATNALNDSGPHQRWATGTLFDNVTVQGDAINVRNRGSFGTSHGWSGANMVIWNSAADSFRVQNPPTAQNWLIGSTGAIVEDLTFGPQPPGYYDSHGAAVTAGGTTSLYEAQFNDAADISEFRFTAATGNWSDPANWNEFLTPGDVYRVSIRDYLQGDVDDFVNDGAGSVDQPYVDPQWQAFVEGSSAHPITGFDNLQSNQNVVFTTQHVLDSGERVIHASLALALRQGGGGVDTDFVRVATAANQFSFGSLGWDAEINGADTYVGVLDLGGILSDLQTGDVNIQVNDDTGVDWALYTATVATPTANPAGTRVFVEGGNAALVDAAVAPIGTLSLGKSGAGTLQVDATGALTVLGAFEQFASGALDVELGGTASGEFGSMAVGGDAALAGHLSVSLAPQYNPTVGDSFAILTAESVSGAFDTVALPAPPADLVWNLDYQPQAVEAQLLFAADFDHDGDVDGRDLATWHDNFGAAGAAHADGDANGDMLVNGADFLIWQIQNGRNVAPLQVVEIPEPAAGFLGLAAAMFLLVSRAARRSLPGPASA